MKSLIKIMTLMLLIGGSVNAGEGWFKYFNKAQAEAKAKNLPILVDFTGSDWCAWCTRLDNEVFQKDAFKNYAKANLVLMIADFPQKKEISDKNLVKQNRQLARRYNVQGFPTVLLLDANGSVLAETGYKAGGAENYVTHLKDLLANAAKKKEKKSAKK